MSRRCLRWTLGSLLSLVVCAASASAQTRIFVNGSFESFAVAPNSIATFPSGTAGWFTTATDGQMEIWGTGFNGIAAQQGTRLAELNGNLPGQFYQTVCLAPGDALTFNLFHRRRATSGTDVMAVRITNPATGNFLQLGANINASNAVWNSHTRTFNADTQGTTLGAGGGALTGPTLLRLGFQAISTATGNNTVGNLLDNITLTGLVPFVQLGPETSSGGEATSPNFRIFVNGIVAQPVTLSLAYSGTATRNTDYTGPDTVTIPAGQYDGTAATSVALPITVIDDGLLEGNETIIITATSLSSTDIRFGPTSCTGATITTVTHTIIDSGARADLSVTKTDGSPTYTPGADIIYSIVVSNAGPSAVTNAAVIDGVPATTTARWTCTPGPGATCPASGTGALQSTPVSIPSGGSVTFRFVLSTSPAFVGQIVNTVTVTLPAGVTDPVPGNNTATDTDTAVSRADLTLSKFSEPKPYVPGATLTYRVTVSNVGPSNATNARVTDTFPSALTGATWTCSGSAGATCPASGSGNIDTLVNLPSGGAIVFVITGTVTANTTGTLTNTARVTPPAGVTDPTPGNNEDTDTSPAGPKADLSITKSSTPNPYVPGQALSYRLVVRNAGPSNVTGARVQDNFPAPLGTFTWTCTAAAGATCRTPSGTGDINVLVDLPVNSTATFQIDGIVPANVSGPLLNSATITEPAGITDPAPGNNQANDANPANPLANLSITKTSAPNPYVPGAPLTYTIVARNAGPSDAVNARVIDALPLPGFTWTCSSTGGTCGMASGAGAIDVLVTLPVGATATFIATGPVPSATTGVLTNTASIVPPETVTDPVPGDNHDTDNNAAGPRVDLSVTKTAAPSPYVPGTPLTFTIAVQNAGPSDAVGARLDDDLPAALGAFTWTCTAGPGSTCRTPSGSGDISTLIDLPVGGSVTFSVTGTVPPGTSGPLDNTAIATEPAGTQDTNQANNTATISVPAMRVADVAIAKSVTPSPYVAGRPLTYTLTVTNAGPSTAPRARVVDAVPAALLDVQWTCAATPGSACQAGSGAGSIDLPVDLAVGGTATFQITGRVPASQTGALTNTGTVAASDQFTDPNTANNTSTVVTNGSRVADLTITKTTSPKPYVPGGPLTHVLIVSNQGPSDVVDARVQDPLPAGFTGFTWMCTASSGGVCSTPTGADSIDTLVTLPVGGSVTIRLTGTSPPSSSGTQTNVATVTPPAGVTDPAPGNNTATDSTPANPEADLTITKSGSPKPYVPGLPFTYTLVVSNLGPTDVPDARVQDQLPAGLAAFTWTCQRSTGAACGTGAGSIDVTLPMPAGTSATFTITGTAPANLTGTLTNAATVTPPPTIADPVPGNNQDTDSSDPGARADLQIVKSSTPDPFVSGNVLTYTIGVTNAGPSDVRNARVQDALPPALSEFAWTCSSAGRCATVSGDGNIDAFVDLPVGEQVVFTVSGIVPPGTPAGPLTNTATVAPPPDVEDPIPGNNTASDTNNGTQVADLFVTKSSSPNPYVPGGAITYSFRVSNAGPSSAPLARVQDALPAGLINPQWTCTASAGATCGTASGAGDVDTLVSLAPGASVTVVITATVPSDETLLLTNTATVTPPAGVTDPVPGNNTATTTNPPGLVADLRVTKVATPETYIAGALLTYTITVTNDGPSDVSFARVQDDLPAPVSSFTWTCTPAGGTCHTTNGVGSIDLLVSLPAGASVTIVASGTVSPAATGTLTNTATVTPPVDVMDPVPGNNTATDNSGGSLVADLRVTKTATPSPHVPGAPLQFVMDVFNDGPSNAVNARVQDALPGALSAFTWTCAPLAGAGVCGAANGAGDIDVLVTLPVGTAVRFTVNGTSPPDEFDTLANTITVAPPAGVDDPTPGNNTASVTVPSAPSADLSIVKTASAPAYVPGQAFTFTLVASNAGPSSVTSAQIADVLPPALAEFVWTCTAGANAVCESSGGTGNVNVLVDLAPGSSVTIALTGVIASSAVGSIANTATIAPPAAVPDPNPANNTSTGTATRAAQADLSVTKTSTPEPFVPGGPLTYTITVTNEGPSDVTGARITDVLPAPVASFTWQCQGSGGAACATDAGAGSIDVLADLPAGSSLLITVTGIIPIVAPTSITNTVTVTPPADVTDPDPGNNTANDTSTSEPTADIEITKRVDRPTPLVGDVITFTVGARNLGPSQGTNLVVAEQPTVGLEIVSGTPSAGTFDAATLQWRIPSLQPGESQTLTLLARVLDAGEQRNVATLTAHDEIDPDPGNNSAGAVLTAAPVADIRVTKTADAASVNIGGSVSFTITTANAGPSNATNVQVQDALPAGLQFVSAFAEAGTYDPATGLWNIGALANGARVTLRINAIVTAAGPIANTAVKTSGNEIDPTPTNDGGGVVVNGEAADLQVVKQALTPGRPTLGQVIRFAITVTNNGPSDTANVRIRDAVPAGLVFISASASQGLYVPATGLWDVGALTATGATSNARLEIAARVVSTASAIVNIADVFSQDRPDPNPANDSSRVEIRPARVDVDTSMEITGDPAVPDVTIDGFVTVTNRSDTTTTGRVVVAVPTPPGMTPMPMGQSGWDCEVVGRTVFCWQNDAVLLPDRSITSGFWWHLDDVPPPGRTVFGHVTHEPDGNAANNVTSLTFIPPASPLADVAIAQMTDVVRLAGSQRISARVRVSNAGPVRATDIVLTDVLPREATFISASVDGGTCAGTQYIACELPALDPGGVIEALVVFDVPLASTFVTHTVTATGSQADPALTNNQDVWRHTFAVESDADTDGDGMTDTWESFMGLSPLRADAGEDPDGDGLSNAEELAHGTHPRGFYRSYFAEGVVGDFFTTQFDVINTDPSGGASVLLCYMRDNGTMATWPRVLPSMQRTTADASWALGLSPQSFATMIESDRPLAADRTVGWGHPMYGGHAETGVPAPSRTWYFAEGATSGFSTFYLLQNPGDAVVDVTVRFLLLRGAPVVRAYRLEPFSRLTIYANQVEGLPQTTMSAAIEATGPIVAERAMYYGGAFLAGHAGVGATAPATDWFFAEGSTGAFFEEFILIANPGDVAAEVQATFARPDGQTVVRPYTIAPHSRFTIWVDTVDPSIAASPVAVQLESTNGVGVVAERAMWWPDGAWQEGHVSLGATATGTSWAVAGGEEGGPQGAQSFVLIANMSDAPGTARVTVILEDGRRLVKVLPLGARVRRTVPIGLDFPEAAGSGTAGQRFSVLVDSLGAAPAPLVVESARYASADGVLWSTGTSALATRLR